MLMDIEKMYRQLSKIVNISIFCGDWNIPMTIYELNTYGITSASFLNTLKSF